VHGEDEGRAHQKLENLWNRRLWVGVRSSMGVGIRNCTKPPLGVNLSIKIDNHGHQKKSNTQLLYLNCGSQLFFKSNIHLKLWDRLFHETRWFFQVFWNT
jgi:hypothetical protein